MTENHSKLIKMITEKLEDMKAIDIQNIFVAEVSSYTDYLIIASGSSDRHTKAIAQHLVEEAKANGHPPLKVEGLTNGEWILVDMGDVVVHIMLPRVRDFYNLEKLWSIPTLKEANS